MNKRFHSPVLSALSAVMPPKAAAASAAAEGGARQHKITAQERSFMITWLGKADNRNIIAGAVLLLLLRCLTRPDRECWQCQSWGGHDIGQVGYDQGTGI